MGLIQLCTSDKTKMQVSWTVKCFGYTATYKVTLVHISFKGQHGYRRYSGNCITVGKEAPKRFLKECHSWNVEPVLIGLMSKLSPVPAFSILTSPMMSYLKEIVTKPDANTFTLHEILRMLQYRFMNL